jgi:hypothetical protein
MNTALGVSDLIGVNFLYILFYYILLYKIFIILKYFKRNVT